MKGTVSLEALRAACLGGKGSAVMDAAEAYEAAWRSEHARFARLLAERATAPAGPRQRGLIERALDDDVRSQLRLALSTRDARRHGRSLLHHAARSGGKSAVDAVLRIALARAPRGTGGSAAIAALLAAQDDEGATPLHIAAAAGSAKAAHRLVEAGAEVWIRDDEGRNPLERASNCAVRAAIVPPIDAVRLACGGDSTALRATLNGGVGGEARLAAMLRAAAGHSSTARCGPLVVRLLLDAGANAALPDGRGRTALHACARACGGRYHRATARALLDGGADAAALTLAGRTALHALAAPRETRSSADDDAATYRCRFARLLLARGADACASDSEGLTALHLAARNGRYALVHALVAAGASPLARSALGDLPLHCAAAALSTTFGCAPVCRLLLRIDADAISGSGARLAAYAKPAHARAAATRHRKQRDVSGRFVTDRFAVVGGGGGRRVPAAEAPQSHTSSATASRGGRTATRAGRLGSQRGAENKRCWCAHDIAARGDAGAGASALSVASLRPMLSLWAAAASANVGVTRALLRSSRHFAASIAARTDANGADCAAARRRRGSVSSKTASAASKGGARGATGDASLVVALRLRSYEVSTFYGP